MHYTNPAMRPILFERRILRALEEAAPVAPGETLLVACSGGADSVALLVALCERVHREPRPWRIVAAHFNHRTRGNAADTDECSVRDLARNLGIDCLTGRRREAQPASETVLRRARYAFLARAAKRVAAQKILTAHHADDQVETILHRLFRGAGLQGLAGIEPARSHGTLRIVRPMLDLSRADIRAYLAARELRYREDASNTALSHTRNRIRHRLLPLIERELNPAARDALLQLGWQAREWNRLFKKRVAAAWRAVRIDGEPGEIALDAAALGRLSPVLVTALIQLALKQLDAPLGRIGFERLRAAAALLSSTRTGRRIEMAGGFRAERLRGRIVVRRATMPKRRAIRSGQTVS